METLLGMLRAVGDSTRLRLLLLLVKAELTVSELTEILGQSQPRVSRHLKLLCEAGLLERFKEGAWVFYRAADQGGAGELARALPLLADSENDPVLIDEDAKADNEELLPSINELNLTGAQALPELHLDVHVYATKPADRFIYINMRKYHEGNALQEGPVVEHIRRDGVVLNFQGLRFILPRQS